MQGAVVEGRPDATVVYDSTILSAGGERIFVTWRAKCERIYAVMRRMRIMWVRIYDHHCLDLFLSHTSMMKDASSQYVTIWKGTSSLLSLFWDLLIKLTPKRTLSILFGWIWILITRHIKHRRTGRLRRTSWCVGGTVASRYGRTVCLYYRRTLWILFIFYHCCHYIWPVTVTIHCLTQLIVKSGVPQGSVLSATLFHDIFKNISFFGKNQEKVIIALIRFIGSTVSREDMCICIW